MNEDKRPPAKPKKHPELWQSWLWFDQLRRVRIASNNRAISAERGKSMMSAQMEYDMIELLDLEASEEFARKKMIYCGSQVGPIWNWVTSIKGLGAGTLAAQLLALIDDISIPPYPSSLCRFAGFSVTPDGKAEKCQRGVKSPYNRKLKGVCWNVADQFIRHYTPIYREIYDDEKERQRLLHPEKIKVDGKWRYNDGHLHNRAWRKMVKMFLGHLWLQWRTFEGLPITEPYIFREGSGHSQYVAPPVFEREVVAEPAL